MDKRIEKVLDTIESNLSRSFSLGDLAGIACMSASQFHRVFKQETNATPFKFIEKIKMQCAYDHMLKQDIQVQELSENLGYQDYETFSRAFKKHFQISPDDLKAIAVKIKSQTNEDVSDNLYFAVFDDEAEAKEYVANKFKEIIEKNQYTEEDLKLAQVFQVSEITNDTSKEMRVKNKFQIKSDTKVWKKLLIQT